MWMLTDALLQHYLCKHLDLKQTVTRCRAQSEWHIYKQTTCSSFTRVWSGEPAISPLSTHIEYNSVMLNSTWGPSFTMSLSTYHTTATHHHSHTYTRTQCQHSAPSLADYVQCYQDAETQKAWIRITTDLIYCLIMAYYPIWIRAHCTSLTKWLTFELTIWLSVDALHKTLTLG